jgi:hypothetical protein
MRATIASVVVGIVSILTPVTSFAVRGAATALIGVVGGIALGGRIGLAQWLSLRNHLRGVT